MKCSSRRRRCSRGWERPRPPADIKRAFTTHLNKLRGWLSGQKNIEVLYVSYNDLVERPEEQAGRIGAFLGSQADVESMARTVDRSLYRNRKTPTESSGGSVADELA